MDLNGAADRGLWVECQLCSDRAPYTGVAVVRDGRIYGLFACPWHSDRFPVWRPEFDSLLAADVAGPATAPLRRLAERLCRAWGTDEAQRIVAEAQAENPTLGAEALVTPDPSTTLELRLTRPPRLLQLEAMFGAAGALPRTGPFASHILAWTVETAGEPARVAIFARFNSPPTPEASPAGLSLRIERLAAC